MTYSVSEFKIYKDGDNYVAISPERKGESQNIAPPDCLTKKEAIAAARIHRDLLNASEEKPEAPCENTMVERIPLVWITAGDNDRKAFDAEALQELAASIEQNGLLQPISVRKTLGWDDAGNCPSCGDAGRCQCAHYTVIAGERRFRATLLLPLSVTAGRIPCIVHDDISDEKASALMLLENTSRADLNPIEEAEAYQSRIDRFGWSPQHLAELAGVSVNRVAKRTALLLLSPEVQKMVRSGKMPLGHAEAISILDSNRQIVAIRVYRASKNMTVSAFREICFKLQGEQDQEALFQLEELLVIEAVDSSATPMSGKKASTGAPTRSDLPFIRFTCTDTTGAIIDRFIADLQVAGLDMEAGAVGTLYEQLVQGNFVTRARVSQILPPAIALAS